MNDAFEIDENAAAFSGDESMTGLADSQSEAISAHPDATDSQQAEIDTLRNSLVMMVDDEPINLEVTQIYLEDSGFSRFVSTSDPTEALAMLASDRPDVLLLDLMMPGMSGFDILREMQDSNILKDYPTIVLTSSHDSGTKLKALELGATDFLSKPVDPSELTLRVRNTLAVKAYRDRLANYDLLTGLPNRRTFLDRLVWALQHAQQYSKTGAMLHIDVDGFKEINDALGPALGDDLLQIIAVRIARCLRNIDELDGIDTDGPQPSLSRLGGDEFAILLPVIESPDGAAGVAQRVLDAMSAPISLSEHELRITCGIGISEFPDDGADTDNIVRNAGVAMHHAKRQKLHSYQFYASELNATALHRLHLANQLREAIDRGQLRLYFQPTSDTRTGKVCGCEALIRWEHPERGLVGPDEFIPLAEETGLIDEIGEWVIRTACEQSKAWNSAGFAAHPISINVSSHQFRQQKLAETLRGIFEETGADPSLLIVEITEGVLLENAEANIRILDDMRALGIKLSMDDFGTGYSSLSYLHSFPLDELKVDRCFVEQIKRPGDRSAIIRAIIAMAHSLGLTVVAEGVETPLQLEYLQSQGCDEYQGYIVSKPLPPEQYASRFLKDASSAAENEESPVDTPRGAAYIGGTPGEAELPSSAQIFANDVSQSPDSPLQEASAHVLDGMAEDYVTATGPFNPEQFTGLQDIGDAPQKANSEIGTTTLSDWSAPQFVLDDSDSTATTDESTRQSSLEALEHIAEKTRASGNKFDPTRTSELAGVDDALASIAQKAAAPPDTESHSADDHANALERTNNDETAAGESLEDTPNGRISQDIDIHVDSVATSQEDADASSISAVDLKLVDEHDSASYVSASADSTSAEQAGTSTEEVPSGSAIAESANDGSSGETTAAPELTLMLVDDDNQDSTLNASYGESGKNAVGDPGKESSHDASANGDVPVITGTLVAGETLSIDTTCFAGFDDPNAFRYHWLRDDTTIDGATSRTYTLTDEDVGACISAKVAAFSVAKRKVAGPLTSAKTSPILGANDASAGSQRASSAASAS